MVRAKAEGGRPSDEIERLETDSFAEGCESLIGSSEERIDQPILHGNNVPEFFSQGNPGWRF